MLFRNLIGGALGGAALAVLAAAPSALAKDTGSFSLTCLGSDTALQSAEVTHSGDPAVITVAPANLWPPNHKMRDLNLSLSLTNNLSNEGSPVTLELIVNSITDDQVGADDPGGSGCGASTAKQGDDWAPTSFPVNASSSVATTSDAVTFPAGEVQARGERCAKDGTRTYSISVTCCDDTNLTNSNPTCDSEPEILLVTVPKSRKHHGKP